MIEIAILKATIFPSEISAGITLRNQSAFHPHGFTISGNIAKDTISQHRQLLAQKLELNLESVKYQTQIHGDTIQNVDFSTGINESDAMITNCRGLALVVSVADCAAILLYDTKSKVIAGIHSGWQSTALNIVGKTIEKMIREYECQVENLIAFISPCAGGDKYEVETDVAKFFPNSIKKISDGKFLLNLKNEVFNQLITKGVIPQNIEISDICTISDNRFHSYRRDNESSGRMGAYIMMKGFSND